MTLVKSNTMSLTLRRLFLLFTSFLFVTFLYKTHANNFASNAIEVEMEDGQASGKQCSPANKIAFMKTHKCGSSTIQNIMFRHALRGDLNLAIPQDGGYLSTTELFNRESALETDWGKLPVDIFTLHSRWNYEEVLALIGPETRTFSTVRDPVDQFSSLYVFYAMHQVYNTDLKGFVDLLRHNRSQVESIPRRYGRLGRNQIAYDWGYSPSEFGANEQYIMDFIHKIEKQFGLVVIAERMEESLVLLADYLCWPLEYVAHLVRNQRKAEKMVKLDDSERETLRKWQNVDNLIYNYFSKRFDEQIKLFDPNYIEQQVKRLRELNEEVQNRCVVAQVGNEKLSGKFKEFSDDTVGYVINPDKPDCDNYAMSEPAFLEMFRKKQTEKASKLNNNSTLEMNLR